MLYLGNILDAHPLGLGNNLFLQYLDADILSRVLYYILTNLLALANCCKIAELKEFVYDLSAIQQTCVQPEDNIRHL